MADRSETRRQVETINAVLRWRLASHESTVMALNDLERLADRVTQLEEALREARLWVEGARNEASDEPESQTYIRAGEVLAEIDAVLAAAGTGESSGGGKT